MNHTPPIDTGLTHPGNYVEEQITEFAETLSDAHEPGVYAIRLSKPEDLESAWDETFEVRHHDFEAIKESDRLYYIGGTKDVFERVDAHARGHQSASIMQVCPPHSIAEVWWYSSTEEAFTRESGHAVEWSNKPGVYVIQN